MYRATVSFFVFCKLCRTSSDAAFDQGLYCFHMEITVQKKKNENIHYS